MRGTAHNVPNSFHDPRHHHAVTGYHHDSDQVNAEDVLHYQNKIINNEFRPLYTQAKPYWQLIFDPEMTYLK